MRGTVNRRGLIGGAIGGAALLAGQARAVAAEKVATFGPPEGVALLSRNENPYGPSPKAIQAASDAASKGAYYAGKAVMTLTDMIAEKNGVTSDYVSVSTGSGEALCAIAQSWTSQGGAILAPELFWDTTVKYAERQGAKILRVPLAEDMSIDLDAMASAVDENISMVHITNPNNPTGMLLDPAKLKAFCLKVESKATVLVDEAYNELTDDPNKNSMMSLVRDGRNVIVARTFSKIYGMAGMRVGYTIARPDISDRIRSNIMSWISSPGVAAAVASYNDESFLAMSKSRILEAREMINDAVKANGLVALPSATNFVYVDVGADANLFQQKMAERQIMIRGVYQDYVNWSRVSTGFIRDVERYVAALPKVLAAM